MSAFKTHFNLSPEEYAAHRGGVVEQRRHQEVLSLLEKPLSQVRSVVELGCGPGKFLADIARLYPDVSFTGIDTDARMIEHASRTYRMPNLAYALRDVSREKTDLVCQLLFSIDVIHHVHDFPAFFQAVHRMLSPGGIWLAIEPNIYHPYIYYSQERMRRAGFDEDHFRPWAAERRFLEAGFTIASRRYLSLFPGWLPRLPRFFMQMEKLLENARFLGGSVVYRLIADPRRSKDESGT